MGLNIGKLAQTAFKIVKKVPAEHWVGVAAIATIGIAGYALCEWGDTFKREKDSEKELIHDDFTQLSDEDNATPVAETDEVVEDEIVGYEENVETGERRPIYASESIQDPSIPCPPAPVRDNSYTSPAPTRSGPHITRDTVQMDDRYVVRYYDNGEEFESQSFTGDSYLGRTLTLDRNGSYRAYDEHDNWSYDVQVLDDETYIQTAETWRTTTYSNGESKYESFAYGVEESNKRYEHKRDSNGNIVYEKEYDENGVLKFTVTPRRNEDGDVIRRDTVRNK